MHECVSSYKAISGAGIFSQEGWIFLENDKNWISFVSTVLPKHIEMKSIPKYNSVCSRVVKTSGLCPDLTSNHPIRGSNLTVHPLFFSLILN